MVFFGWINFCFFYWQHYIFVKIRILIIESIKLLRCLKGKQAHSTYIIANRRHGNPMADKKNVKVVLDHMKVGQQMIDVQRTPTHRKHQHHQCQLGKDTNYRLVLTNTLHHHFSMSILILYVLCEYTFLPPQITLLVNSIYFFINFIFNST